MNIAERLRIARENIAERLEPLLERAAEMLHPIREQIRYFRHMGINTDIVRIKSDENVEKFINSLADNRAGGRVLGEKEGIGILLSIARLGAAMIKLPLTMKERFECIIAASDLRQTSSDAHSNEGMPEFGITHTNVSGARAAFCEEKADSGKDPLVCIFNRKTRIAAGKKILQLKLESADVIARDKRFPRPVRREAKAAVKQRKLALLN